MPRDLDLDFEFQDEEVRERPVRPTRQAPRREGAPQRSGGRGAGPSRRRKNDTTSIIILIIEIVVISIPSFMPDRIWMPRQLQ